MTDSTERRYRVLYLDAATGRPGCMEVVAVSAEEAIREALRRLYAPGYPLMITGCEVVAGPDPAA